MTQKGKYTDEKSLLIILSLLKSHGIKKVIASPGSTNHTLVASMQHDDWFEMYSSVDERSAAYMACGLSAESGEPVVITCTEATAARNYMPGLTEAYYRKLPILAITTTHGKRLVGQHVAQVIDHSVLPHDVAKMNVFIPKCVNKSDEDYITLKVNEAILELSHHGGGPVYLNVETSASRVYSMEHLPQIRKIERICYEDVFPKLPDGRIGILVGTHRKWSDDVKEAVENFCKINNAVVFCDHTSGYNGRYKVIYSLAGSQDVYRSELSKLRLIIRIGEVSGDYFSACLGGQAEEVWRVSEDGILVDQWHNLRYVFEMSEKYFFSHYTSSCEYKLASHVIDKYDAERHMLEKHIPELPFSKVWIAREIMRNMPQDSYLHFSILGALRAGNFCELPEYVRGNCNVGGFGIDGATSTFIGASLANKDKLHFLMTGDLAFFYDLNAIGNRHIGNNVRILLVNNGDGTEFRMYWHPISTFSKKDADLFMAAGGHFGNQSKSFVKNMAEALGFEYMSASTKEDFLKIKDKFLSDQEQEKPMLIEVFTYSETDSEAVQIMRNLIKDQRYSVRMLKKQVKTLIKETLGESTFEKTKKILRR